MNLSRSELKYHLIALRAHYSYLIFQLAQLALSIVIITVALTSKAHFRTTAVIIMEFILLLSLCVDLFIIKCISEGCNFQSKSNWVDLAIIVIFTITLLFLVFSKPNQNSSKSFEPVLEADDIIIICIVIARYAIQIVRMLQTINNTRKNMNIEKEMQQYDLNIPPQHTNIYNQEMEIEDVLRYKIKSKSGDKNQEQEQQKNNNNNNGNINGNNNDIN